MDQFDKQKILSLISGDLKRMVVREVSEVVKKNSTKLPSHNSLISNAMVDSNMIYSDFNIKLNQEAYTNDNVYQRMKNQIQYRNGTTSSTFINKGSKNKV